MKIRVSILKGGSFKMRSEFITSSVLHLKQYFILYHDRKHAFSGTDLNTE